MKTENEYRVAQWGETIFSLISKHVCTIKQLTDFKMVLQNLSACECLTSYLKTYHPSGIFTEQARIAKENFGGDEALHTILSKIITSHNLLFKPIRMPTKKEASDALDGIIDRLEKPAKDFLKVFDEVKFTTAQIAVRRFINNPYGEQSQVKAICNISPRTELKALLKSLPFAYFNLLKNHSIYTEKEPLDDALLEAFFPISKSPLLHTKYFPSGLNILNKHPDGSSMISYKSFRITLESTSLYYMLVDAHKSDIKDQQNPEIIKTIEIRNNYFKQFHESYTALKTDANIIKSSVYSSKKTLQQRVMQRLEKEKLVTEPLLADSYPYIKLITRTNIDEILEVITKEVEAHRKQEGRTKNKLKKPVCIIIPSSLKARLNAELQLRKETKKNSTQNHILTESLKKIEAFDAVMIAAKSDEIGFIKDELKCAYLEKERYKAITVDLDTTIIRDTANRIKKSGLGKYQYYNFALKYYFSTLGEIEAEETKPFRSIIPPLLTEALMDAGIIKGNAQIEITAEPKDDTPNSKQNQQDPTAISQSQVKPSDIEEKQWTPDHDERLRAAFHKKQARDIKRNL